MNFRTKVKQEDLENVKNITESTGFFYDHEVEVVVDIVAESLEIGDAAGYQYLFVEDENKNTVGFTIFGEIPCTKARYDIYWIVVHNNMRGKGIGKLLMNETEKQIMKMGGEIAYLETSSQQKYIPTCKFYDSLNYFKEAEIKDFYSNNDNKIIYSKRLQTVK